MTDQPDLNRPLKLSVRVRSYLVFEGQLSEDQSKVRQDVVEPRSAKKQAYAR